MDNKINLHNIAKWVLVAIFIVTSVLNFLRIDSQSHSNSDTIRPFIIQSVFIVFILYFIYRIIDKTVK